MLPPPKKGGEGYIYKHNPNLLPLLLTAYQRWYHTFTTTNISLLLCCCLATLMASCESFSASGRHERLVFIVTPNSILHSGRHRHGCSFTSVASARRTVQHFDDRYHQNPHSQSSTCRRVILKG